MTVVKSQQHSLLSVLTKYTHTCPFSSSINAVMIMIKRYLYWSEYVYTQCKVYVCVYMYIYTYIHIYYTYTYICRYVGTYWTQAFDAFACTLAMSTLGTSQEVQAG